MEKLEFAPGEWPAHFRACINDVLFAVAGLMDVETPEYELSGDQYYDAMEGLHQDHLAAALFMLIEQFRATQLDGTDLRNLMLAMQVDAVAAWPVS